MKKWHVFDYSCSWAKCLAGSNGYTSFELYSSFLLSNTASLTPVLVSFSSLYTTTLTDIESLIILFIILFIYTFSASTVVIVVARGKMILGCPSILSYLSNALGEFLQIWCQCPIGLGIDLIRIKWHPWHNFSFHIFNQTVNLFPDLWEQEFLTLFHILSNTELVTLILGAHLETVLTGKISCATMSNMREASTFWNSSTHSC